MRKQKSRTIFFYIHNVSIITIMIFFPSRPKRALDER